MEYFYFDTARAIKEHDFIIDKSGGLKGLKDIGLIDSILEHIQNDAYYPTFQDKISHLFYSINKNHAFNDGNKRTSIVLSAYFLELNGFDFKVSYFIQEMENIAVHVADNRIGKELLHKIISCLIYENEYNEELQLEIVNAISTELDFDGDSEY